MPLHEVAPRDEAAHVEVLHHDRLDVDRARPAAAAVVVGRRDQREAADRRVGLQGRDGRLEPARLELERVVHAGEVVARATSWYARSRPQWQPWAPAALEVERVDAPAQVLAQQVGRVLVAQADRRPRRAARPAERSRGCRAARCAAPAAVVDMKATMPTVGGVPAGSRSPGPLRSPVTPPPPAHEVQHRVRGRRHGRRELLAERLHVFRLDGEHDDLLGHVVAEPVTELRAPCRGRWSGRTRSGGRP